MRSKIINNIFSIIIFAFILLGCNKKKEHLYYNINIKDKEIPKYGIALSTVDWSVSDIKITKDYYCFLSNNKKSIINISKKDQNKKHIHLLDSFPNKNMHFTNEISKGNDNTLFLTKNNTNLLRLNITDCNISIDTSSLNLPANMRGYNIFENMIFASNFKHTKKSPYCFLFNSKHQWVEPDPLLSEKVGKSLSYINYMCVNERYKSVAVAYRFVNFLSFYDFEGNLQCTTEIETSTTPFEVDINNPNTIKFFIDIYGTEKFIYCLYSGSNDLTASSRVLKFNWDGNHVGTFILDRPIQFFAVDEINNHLIAISSHHTEGENIILYSLE